MQMDESVPEPRRQRRILGRREEAQRDPADGDARAEARGARRNRLGARHRRAEGRGRRRQRAALARPRDRAGHALPAAARLHRARPRARAVRRPHRQVRRQGAGARAREARLRLGARRRRSHEPSPQPAIAACATSTALRATRRPRMPGWPRARQARRAAPRFAARLGFPARRGEDWRYTNLRRARSQRAFAVPACGAARGVRSRRRSPPRCSPHRRIELPLGCSSRRLAARTPRSPGFAPRAQPERRDGLERAESPPSIAGAECAGAMDAAPFARSTRPSPPTLAVLLERAATRPGHALSRDHWSAPPRTRLEQPAHRVAAPARTARGDVRSSTSSARRRRADRGARATPSTEVEVVDGAQRSTTPIQGRRSERNAFHIGAARRSAWARRGASSRTTYARRHADVRNDLARRASAAGRRARLDSAAVSGRRRRAAHRQPHARRSRAAPAHQPRALPRHRSAERGPRRVQRQGRRARGRAEDRRAQNNRNLLLTTRSRDRHQARARDLRRRREVQPRRDDRPARRPRPVLPALARHRRARRARAADAGVRERVVLEIDILALRRCARDERLLDAPARTEEEASSGRLDAAARRARGTRRRRTCSTFDVRAATFPILARQVHGKPLVYLDNAASTQRRAVIDADRRATTSTTTPTCTAASTARGRGHRALRARPRDGRAVRRRGRLAGDRVRQERDRGDQPRRAELRPTALRTGRRDPDHRARAPREHRAVAAGLRADRRRAQGRADRRRGRRRLRRVRGACSAPRTQIVAVAHVSNALGTVNAGRARSSRWRARAAPVLVDGAQAVPHMPVDVQALDCDFYAFSGHKMYGPTGIGVLYGKRELLEAMPPWQGGGDMILECQLREARPTTTCPTSSKPARRTSPARRPGRGARLPRAPSASSASPRTSSDLLDYATTQLQRAFPACASSAPRPTRRRSSPSRSMASTRTTSAPSSITKASPSAPATTARCR